MLEKLEQRYDAKRLLHCLLDLELTGQQIHTSSPDGETYFLPSGDLFKQNLNQDDFTEVNTLFKDTYVDEVYQDLDELYGICRGRFMWLGPEFRGYSYHYDLTDRIHIPILTNEDSIFIVNDTVLRMPDVGCTYRLKTTLKHTAMNLGKEDRLHFTVCIRGAPDLTNFYKRMMQ